MREFGGWSLFVSNVVNKFLQPFFFPLLDQWKNTFTFANVKPFSDEERRIPATLPSVTCSINYSMRPFSVLFLLAVRSHDVCLFVTIFSWKPRVFETTSTQMQTSLKNKKKTFVNKKKSSLRWILYTFIFVNKKTWIEAFLSRKEKNSTRNCDFYLHSHRREKGLKRDTGWNVLS